VLEATLEDSRQQIDPLPLQLIDLPAQATGQFLKFELMKWYGSGGGLQYFDIQRGNNQRKITSNTTRGSVRLNNYPKGRVEIFDGVVWGTLCGHYW
jgi:hypothetical protein